mgnify:CR=1 FL=1
MCGFFINGTAATGLHNLSFLRNKLSDDGVYLLGSIKRLDSFVTLLPLPEMCQAEAVDTCYLPHAQVHCLYLHQSQLLYEVL